MTPCPISPPANGVVHRHLRPVRWHRRTTAATPPLRHAAHLVEVQGGAPVWVEWAGIWHAVCHGRVATARGRSTRGRPRPICGGRDVVRAHDDGDRRRKSGNRGVSGPAAHHEAPSHAVRMHLAGDVPPAAHLEADRCGRRPSRSATPNRAGGRHLLCCGADYAQRAPPHLASDAHAAGLRQQPERSHPRAAASTRPPVLVRRPL